MRSPFDVALVTATVLAPVPGLAQVVEGRPEYWHDERMWDHMGSGWGHMMFGSGMMIFALILVVLVVVFAVRWLTGDGMRQGGKGGSNSVALEILRERFARGEIEKEEFEERKRLLSP